MILGGDCFGDVLMNLLVGIGVKVVIFGGIKFFYCLF